VSRSQLRNCAAKRRFLSKDDARVATGNKHLGVYSCPVCSGFHLTSKFSLDASDRREAVRTELEKPSFDSSLLARARWKKESR
jgi:hypothetical protein